MPQVVSGIVRVTVDIKGVDKEFDYSLTVSAFAPAYPKTKQHFEPELPSSKAVTSVPVIPQVGTVVRVPFGRGTNKRGLRFTKGWITALNVTADTNDQLKPVEIKPVEKILSIGPPSKVVELARWAGWRWGGSFRVGGVVPFLNLASPPKMYKLAPVGREFVMRDALKALAAVDNELVEVSKKALGMKKTVVVLPPLYNQFAFVESILSTVQMVTSATPLVLCPTKYMLDQLVQHLRSHGWPVAVMPQDYDKAYAGGCVVVGTRSAAWAPIADLSVGIVLDAHDSSYIEQHIPTWNAWETVGKRADQDGVPCICVSPCPTVELLAWALPNEAVRLPKSTERRFWPKIRVVDLKDQDPYQGIFPDLIVDIFNSALSEPGKQVVCILNRIGGAILMACAKCNTLMRCEDCNYPLQEAPVSAEAPKTTSKVEKEDAVDANAVASGGANGALLRPSMLVCKRCSTLQPLVCGNCGSQRVRILKLGANRAAKELSLLTRKPLSVISGSKSRADLLKSDLLQAPIIFGTETVLHQIHQAAYVVFVDFDRDLMSGAGETCIGSYSGRQMALEMLVKATRLVGYVGGVVGGRVIVQTRLPEHEVVQAASQADFTLFTNMEARRRQRLGLPPFKAVAILSGEDAKEYALALEEYKNQAGLHIASVIGDTGSVQIVDNGKGQWSVKADNYEILCNLLAGVVRTAKKIRIEIK